MVRVCALILSLLLPTLVQALELRDILPEDQQKLKIEQPQLFVGTPSQPQLDEAIRYLMKVGTYESVSFQKRADGEFVVVGRPLRAIEDIRFTGEDAFSTSRLLEVLELQPGDKFDRKKAVAAGERLKQFYGESGYFNTVINLSFPKGKNQNVILQFNIVENAPCRIKGLSIITENGILKSRLAGRLSRYLNRPLTEELVNQLKNRTNEYFVSNRYLTAELIGPDVKYNDEKSEATISFEIKDPYRWEFFFDGNVFSSQLDIFQALDLSNHERKNVEPASEGADRIKKDYLSKGFPQVQVEYQVDTDVSQYLKKVFYNIHESPRVRLLHIEITGRISRDPSYYADFITSNSSELIARGYYNRFDLDEGFKNLTTELRNQGYLRAKVQSSRIEYDSSKQNATVIVLLDEGPLTLVQTVSFEGNHFFSNYELAGVLGLTTSSPLLLNELDAGMGRIKNFYHKQGFIEMKILNEGEDVVKYNDTGTLARLTLRLHEGPRVRIAGVKVEGNSFTKTWVVLMDANFKVGDILTPEMMDNAADRLNRSGLFSRVDIHTLEEGTSVSERTVIISVADRDPGILRFGAGVNNERDLTARTFGSFSYNNLEGTARSLSGRVQLQENIPHINFLESDVTVSYLEPFLFDSLTRGRVTYKYSEHIFDYNTINDPILTEITLSNSITFSLERDFNRHFRGTWKLYSLEERKDFERNGNCIPAPVINGGPQQFICSADTQFVATIGPTFDIDYRDNPFLPSRGSLTRIIGEYSDPLLGSSTGVNFVHAELHEFLYTPLSSTSKRWVWANQGRVGYLANVSSASGSGVPAANSFFLGGVDTVRGFDTSQDNERIPPEWLVPVIEGNQILVTSDSHYWLVKTELRFPISGDHGGVIFYDGGSVAITGTNLTAPVCVNGTCYVDRAYRDSVGIGYRYNTPVGAVSLDLAFKINPINTPEGREQPFRVHFSIGSF